MPVYTEHGVNFLWLLDPQVLTLEAYRLESGRWIMLGSYAEDDLLRVEPFQEIEINLGELWPQR